MNNPFARSLHPSSGGRRSVAQWIVLAVVSLVAGAIMLAAFVLPLLLGYGLFAKSHGRWGMIATGVIVALIYLLIVVRMLRRKRG